MKRLLVLGLFALQACAPTSSNSGKTLYNDKCSVCHGATGQGDGEFAAQLGSKPADLTQIAARRDGVWPMLEVMAIVDGYSARYLPGTDMPIYNDFVEGNLIAFDTGNGVQQTAPASLVAITRYLETLQDPKPVRTVP